MVLLDDVVEVLVLTHQDVDAGVGLDALNGRRVGAALVNGDLLWHIVQVDGALLHHLLDVAKAQRVSHIPAHAGEHNLKPIVQPFEDLAQAAVDQTLAEIKHGPDCRLCLLQQNPQTWQAHGRMHKQTLTSENSRVARRCSDRIRPPLELGPTIRLERAASATTARHSFVPRIQGTTVSSKHFGAVYEELHRVERGRSTHEQTIALAPAEADV